MEYEQISRTAVIQTTEISRQQSYLGTILSWSDRSAIVLYWLLT